MTREEALQTIKEKIAYYESDKRLKGAIETLIPELTESKDDRFLKYILDVCKECVNTNDRGLELSMSTTKQLLSYLEKQKEEEGYEAIPVESTLEYKLGFKAGKESEKQKEQKPAEYIKRNSKEWYALISEQYDKGYWNGKAEKKIMKPRVKINGTSGYGEWEPGDTGIVDGYCRGGNDVPYAVVILDKNFRFVMVNLNQLEQI